MSWRCKDKSCVGDRLEVVLPIGATLDEVENEYGKVEMAEDGKWWLTLKRIVSVKGKEFECIHSGDLNDIILPVKFPSYTILRRDIVEARRKKGLDGEGPQAYQRREAEK
jgi:putative protease